MTIAITDPIGHLFECFKDAPAPSFNPHPFEARVAVIRVRPPRHEYFDFIRDHGSPNLSALFAGHPLHIGSEGALTFVFPERWLSVHEQRGLMAAIAGHPDVEKVKRVDIVTSCPIILSDFVKEQIRVLEFEDDSKYLGGRG